MKNNIKNSINLFIFFVVNISSYGQDAKACTGLDASYTMYISKSGAQKNYYIGGDASQCLSDSGAVYLIKNPTSIPNWITNIKIDLTDSSEGDVLVTCLANSTGASRSTVVKIYGQDIGRPNNNMTMSLTIIQSEKTSSNPVKPPKPTSICGFETSSQQIVTGTYEGVTLTGNFVVIDDCTRGVQKNGYTKPDWVTRVNFDLESFSITVKDNLTALDRTGSVMLEIAEVDEPEDATYRHYINITQPPRSSEYFWYPDADGDSYGSFFEEFTFSITPLKGFVNNNFDKCPYEYSKENNGCKDPYENRNWTRAEAYDVNGKIIGASKSYFDELGKGIQTQSYDVKENKVWAAETLYDEQGRPTLQTMSAPIKKSEPVFQYKEAFIKDTSGNTFDKNDLGTLNNDPSQVGNMDNTLGAYYSASRTTEKYQDVTDRPYSRTYYDELNPGKILKVVGGSKIDTNDNGIPDTYPQGFSFTMPATQELYYAFGIGNFDFFTKENAVADIRQQAISQSRSNDELVLYEVRFIKGLFTNTTLNESVVNYVAIATTPNYWINKWYNVQAGSNVYNVQHGEWSIKMRFIREIDRSSALGKHILTHVPPSHILPNEVDLLFDNNIKKANPNIIKTIAIDAHGDEVVSFAYTNGQVLASARSGEGPHKEVISLIEEQGYVDIHLPKGCDGSLSFIGGASNYKVFDLKTSKLITNTSDLPAGVYRIHYRTLDYPQTNLTYIDQTTGEIKAISDHPRGVTYNINYYDYSLNYYDDAGNLTSKLQPLGFDNEAYANYNLTGKVSHIKEDLKSHFKYNTLGQLLYTKSPDEGEAWFKYRTDGQIRFSQNSKQKENGEFSYTNYDSKARPVESGVYLENNTYSFNSGLDTIVDKVYTYNQYVADNVDELENAHCNEQHFTLYDVGDTPGLAAAFNSPRISQYGAQSFVAGNVSKTFTQNPATTTTWYSYDIYGRVKWIVQDIDGLDTPKTIDYEYDPVTGAVTKVYYQKGIPREQFIHKYTYDPDDYSLVQVETSTDNQNFTIHATYEYYETGALKRTVLAEGLQGIDYVYNLNGALKAINHPSLDPSKDPGQDDNDVFGMMIDYYKGDYSREGVHMNTSNAGQDQYNGNIKAVRWNNNATDTDTENEKTYAYSYDRNNWLTAAKFGQNTAGNADGATIIIETNEDITESIAATEEIEISGDLSITGTDMTFEIVGFSENDKDDYGVSNITYDANGNIQSLKRNKNTVDGSNKMDNMEYHYDPNKPNQLARVEDLVTQETNAEDIKTQNTNNYEYNSIGQLAYNNAEGIAYIYTASGLVSEIKQDNTTLLKFFYNDRGHRVKKESYNPNTGSLDYTDVYVRDAAGTPMAIYRDDAVVEHTVYGASRLGVFKRSDASTAYELTDHLGNVRAVIKKDNSYTGTDYYPFGMPMPLRNSLSDYRYAYQGQEKDAETGKEAFQLRLWDARIGRWLTTDPYGQYSSPYLGMGNNPITGIDPDGGYKTWFGALIGWAGNGYRGKISNTGGEGNRKFALDLTDYDNASNGAYIHLKYSSNFGVSDKLNTAWNSNIRRGLTGDALQVSLGYDANVFLGAGQSVDFNWLLTGEDGSVFPYVGTTVKGTVSDGIDVSAGVSFSRSHHTGSVYDITMNSLNGPSYGGAVGGKILIGGSIGGSYQPDGNYGWFTGTIEAGVGVSLSPATAVNIKGEVGYTLIQAHTGGNGFAPSEFLD